MGTVILALIGWSFPDVKATVLGLWGVLLLLVIGALVTIEYVKQNIAFAQKTEVMADPELMQALAREEAAMRSSAPLDEIAEYRSSAPPDEQAKTYESAGAVKGA